MLNFDVLEDKGYVELGWYRHLDVESNRHLDLKEK